MEILRNLRFGMDGFEEQTVTKELPGEELGLRREQLGYMFAARLVAKGDFFPLRRMRVLECELDPEVFPPEKTLMKRSGAASPGDPALVIPLLPSEPDDPRFWYFYDHRPDGTHRYRSELFCILHCPDTGASLLAGFLSCADQAARVHVEMPPDGAPLRLRMVTYLNGRSPSVDKPVVSELAAVDYGSNPIVLLERYLENLRNRYGTRPLKTLTGWSDWQYYRRDITEKDVRINVERLAAEKYPIEYILVDDGFQRQFGDWLSTNPKFPSGLNGLADFIRANGYSPGLWIAPLTTRADSDLALEHAEWLVKNIDGETLLSKSHMGDVVALDFTHPGARRWLFDIVRTIARDHGCKWIKLDGPILRYVEHGRFHDKEASAVSMIRKALETIREAAGDDVVVEGEGYYGPSFGLVETQRVTQDIQPEWPRMKDNVRDNLASTFYHRRFWVNNPDAFILRDTSSPYRDVEGDEHILAGPELELEITALALTGGVVMLTDRMDILAPERAALVDAFIPPYKHSAEPLPEDFMRIPYPQRFQLRVETDWEKWWVGACFNWDDEEKEIEYPLPKKIINPVIADFWRREILFAESGQLRLKVPPHGVRLFSVREKPSRPGIVGCFRHITQGGVEIIGVESLDDELLIKLLPSRVQTVLLLDSAGEKLLPPGESSGYELEERGDFHLLSVSAGTSEVAIGLGCKKM